MELFVIVLCMELFLTVLHFSCFIVVTILLVSKRFILLLYSALAPYSKRKVRDLIIDFLKKHE